MSDKEQIQTLLTKANKLVKDNKLVEATPLFESIINHQLAASVSPQDTEEINKIKEDAILGLGSVFRMNRDAKAIQNLVVNLRPFFATIPQAKTGKLVRGLIDEVSKIEGSSEMVIELCKDGIKWTEDEKRTFLRMNLQTKLAEAYFEIGKYNEGKNIVGPLLREVKKLDDKRLLVSIHLLESRIYHSLRDLIKSRASLTAARTAANAIYCPPGLQAELDLQSGTLHAEEGDYKTAYSYFYEGYENYQSLSKENEDKSKLCLKYMLLMKIMAGGPEEVSNLINGKLALQFADENLKSMLEIVKAYQESSLLKFKETIEKHKAELEEDPVIHSHLQQLYQKLLADNLLRIVTPFSQVEISHVAELIQLDVEQVERKLSQMILDKKLNGILDQGNDCLIVFDDPEPDGTYPAAQETINYIGTVVDTLYGRANRLR